MGLWSRLISDIKIINKYRITFKNWMNVLYSIKIKKPDVIEFEFRNGKKIKLKCFEKGVRNGEFSAFLGDYKFLEPIKDNTVIDIGANIGDSALWFAIMGANRVIAFEPYKYSYNFAIKNTQLNDLNETIILVNAGYGKDGFIELEDTVTNEGTVLKEYKRGLRTPIMSLKTILEKYSHILKGELLLKMDCEGCEYNIFQENKETLMQFKRVLIEYHNGYEGLKKYLEECGFRCSFTGPHKQGYLYAKNGRK